jgi:hypothetical protein
MEDLSKYNETCKLRQVAKNIEADAVVQDFISQIRLTVIVNKAIKVLMYWNGQVYEGRAAGMDFTSDGPLLIKPKKFRW